MNKKKKIKPLGQSQNFDPVGKTIQSRLKWTHSPFHSERDSDVRWLTVNCS